MFTKTHFVAADHLIPIGLARTFNFDSLKSILRFWHSIVLSWHKEEWWARGEAPDTLCFGRQTRCSYTNVAAPGSADILPAFSEQSRQPIYERYCVLFLVMQAFQVLFVREKDLFTNPARCESIRGAFGESIQQWLSRNDEHIVVFHAPFVMLETSGRGALIGIPS